MSNVTKSKTGCSTFSPSMQGLLAYAWWYLMIFFFTILRFTLYQEDDPSPGKPFYGGIYEAYLPDCEKTKKLLPRLKKAFRQGLTFTVVSKETEARVTWDCIPHKTSLQGGKSGWVRLLRMSNWVAEIKVTNTRPCIWDEQSSFLSLSGMDTQIPLTWIACLRSWPHMGLRRHQPSLKNKRQSESLCSLYFLSFCGNAICTVFVDSSQVMLFCRAKSILIQIPVYWVLALIAAIFDFSSSLFL